MKFVDIHCHILPGVDDGAVDEHETRQMLQMAYNEGIRVVVEVPPCVDFSFVRRALQNLQ